MITQLASFLCLALAQASNAKPVLYRIEIYDDKGSVTKPIVRTLENEGAEIKMDSGDKQLKFKLVPGTIKDLKIDSMLEIWSETPLLGDGGKAIGKNMRGMQMGTTVEIGKTTVWQISDTSIVSAKMPKNHKAPKGGMLVSILIETPNESP